MSMHVATVRPVIKTQPAQTSLSDEKLPKRELETVEFAPSMGSKSTSMGLQLTAPKASAGLIVRGQTAANENIKFLPMSTGAAPKAEIDPDTGAILLTDRPGGRTGGSLMLLPVGSVSSTLIKTTATTAHEAARDLVKQLNALFAQDGSGRTARFEQTGPTTASVMIEAA